jgi:hypothetical protein
MVPLAIGHRLFQEAGEEAYCLLRRIVLGSRRNWPLARGNLLADKANENQEQDEIERKVFKQRACEQHDKTPGKKRKRK